MENVLYQATAEGANVVVREAKINSGKGGEFPNRITGNLMRSIKAIPKTKSADRCEFTVGSDMDYACRLEYGYTGPDKLGRTFHQAPRPYLRRAIDENKDNVNEAFREKFEDVLRGA
jgi:HK97 gp10 family phage protein